jgi:hypothetical protein
MLASAVDVLKAMFKDQKEFHKATLAEQRETNRLLRVLAGEAPPPPRRY